MQEKQSSKTIAVSKLEVEEQESKSSNVESFVPTQREKDAQEREEIMETQEIKNEIYYTKTRRLSNSSTGSLPPCSEYNPFVKAQGQQRKDFSYVTNLRKEVIQIVEPYRSRVLTFDDRIGALEKIVLDLEFNHNEFKD